MLIQSITALRPVGINILPKASKNIVTLTNTISSQTRSPFLEPMYSSPYTVSKVNYPAQTPNCRFIHGTSAKSLESIKKEGVKGNLYITTNPTLAWNYAQKQADFDKSEKVIVVAKVDPKKMIKNDFDQYFTTNAGISVIKSIEYSEKDTPDAAVELAEIARRDAEGLKFQLKIAAVLSSPLAYLLAVG